MQFSCGNLIFDFQEGLRNMIAKNLPDFSLLSGDQSMKNVIIFPITSGLVNDTL